MLKAIILASTVIAAAQCSPQEAAQVIADVNAVRVEYGLSALEPDIELIRFAAVRAEDILWAGEPSHDGIWRLYRPTEIGECLCIKPPHESASSCMEAWLESPGHRAMILDTRWGRIGVAALRSDAGYLYVALEFAD